MSQGTLGGNGSAKQVYQAASSGAARSRRWFRRRSNRASWIFPMANAGWDRRQQKVRRRISRSGARSGTMLAEYGNADRAQWQRCWGLVELTAWRGKGVREVRDLNLTAFSSRNGLRSLIAMLKCWRTDKVESFPRDKMREDMLTTCDEMISAVKMAQRVSIPHDSARQHPHHLSLTRTMDISRRLIPKMNSSPVRSKTALAVNNLRGNQSGCDDGGT